jgi:hypothetical protein
MVIVTFGAVFFAVRGHGSILQSEAGGWIMFQTMPMISYGRYCFV